MKLGYNFDKVCPKSSLTHCKNIIEKAQVELFYFHLLSERNALRNNCVLRPDSHFHIKPPFGTL